jgi:predicted flap endonuclease-1-like 5' DNA nuclease
MNTVTAFVLGLIIGWGIEWIIDWVYWRRRTAEMTRRLELAESRQPQEAVLKKSESIKLDLENQIAKLKSDNAVLQQKVTTLEAQNMALPAPAAATAITTAIKLTPAPVTPDDLIVIKGIGPVISRKLNDAGIFTFRELAATTPERLREIVGDAIQRLANEDDILNQAKELAAGQDQSANS